MFENEQTAALFRNICMLVAMVGACRIAVLGIQRYKTDPTWQLIAVGGLLLAGSYVAILGMSGFGDSFFTLTHRGLATSADFVFFLKAGLLLVVFGAFSVTKKLRS